MRHLSIAVPSVDEAARDLTASRIQYVRELRLSLGLAEMTNLLGDFRPDVPAHERWAIAKNLLALAFFDAADMQPTTTVRAFGADPDAAGVLYCAAHLNATLFLHSDFEDIVQLADRLIQAGLMYLAVVEPYCPISAVVEVLSDLRTRDARKAS